jgi:diguanylate cyclase (GGDEF)-like protein
MHSLHEIRYQFLSQLDEEIRLFVMLLEQIAEDSVSRLETDVEMQKSIEEIWDPLLQKIQSLKDTAAMFNFREVATKILIFEDRCLEWKTEDEILKKNTEATIQQLSVIRIQHTKRIIQSLQNEITSLLVMPAEPEEDSQQENLEILRERENSMLFTLNVVTDNEQEFGQLPRQLQLFRYQLNFKSLEEVQQEILEKKNEASEDDHIHTVYLIDLSILRSQFDQKQAKNLFRSHGRMTNKNDYPWIAIGKTGSLEERLSAVRMRAVGFSLGIPDLQFLLPILDRICKHLKEEPFRIVIYDDDEMGADYFATALQNDGMNATFVTNPNALLEELENWIPDVCILNMNTPFCSGLELAEAIRQQDKFVSMPILFLSSGHTLEVEAHAVQIGGDELLYKSARIDHLVSIVRARATRARQIRSLSEKDSLTGLLNHARIKANLEMEIARVQRDNVVDGSLVFVMIDIDHFKKVNDTYGHLTGDQVIQGLARLLRDRFRQTDSVGRYGGEEFAVVMPNCSIDNAIDIFEELREQFAHLQFQYDDTTFSCTFSVGVACFTGGESAQLLNEKADQALYLSKNRGRNCISIFGRKYA